MNSKDDCNEMIPFSQTATKVNTDARHPSHNEPDEIYLGSAKPLGKITMHLYPCGFQTRLMITGEKGELIYTARIEQGADKHWYAMSGDHKEGEKSFVTIREFAQVCAHAHLNHFIAAEKEKPLALDMPVQMELEARVA